MTQKRSYDKRACVRTFQPGDLVWREYKPQAAQHKFAPAWKGPYRVVERVGDVNYRIKLTETGPPTVVHVDHLKKFESASDRESLSEEPDPEAVASEAESVDDVASEHGVDDVDDSASPPNDVDDTGTSVAQPEVELSPQRAVPPTPAPRRTRYGRIVRPLDRLDL